VTARRALAAMAIICSLVLVGCTHDNGGAIDTNTPATSTTVHK
jgi:hypothetical protein